MSAPGVSSGPVPLLTTLCLPGVERSFFTVRAAGEGRSVRVLMTGTADLRSHTALESFLAALHRETVAVAAEEVHVDVRALEFMSAACFRLVVDWLAKVDETGRRYRVVFCADRDRRWQRRSMEALTSFAGAFVSVISAH
jgi:hypothetical protein